MSWRRRDRQDCRVGQTELGPTWPTLDQCLRSFYLPLSPCVRGKENLAFQRTCKALASLSSLLGAHTWPAFDGNQSSLPFLKILPTLVLALLCSCPSFEWCLPQKGSFWCSRCIRQHPIFQQEKIYKPSLRALKSKYTLLCFNRKFIRAAYVHDSCLGKFVESKTHKVANRLRKIKWNKRPMKRKSTTYITSWVLPGDTTDVHLLFTIWHCKIFWVVLTGRLLSSNKACESACLWRVLYAFRDD